MSAEESHTSSSSGDKPDNCHSDSKGTNVVPRPLLSAYPESVQEWLNRQIFGGGGKMKNPLI